MPKIPDNWEGSLMDRDPGLKYRWERVKGVQNKMEKCFAKATRHFSDLLKNFQELEEEITKQHSLYEEELIKAMERDQKRFEAYERKMEWKVKQLRKQLKDSGHEERVAPDQVALSRAKTFAILDSILFAIENWATDDSPAPDITLAAQATIFPVIFEKVSRGDEDYYLTEVPSTADEVVRRGREFVKSFRDDEHISVLDPTGWEILQPVLHKWWTRDALPLLYGASDPQWQNEDPYTMEKMITWRDMEMSRSIEMPLIFDGFELVKKYGDEIREESGLPELSRRVMQTRIKTND